jgi:DNA-binding response OmpR family regulator
VKIVVIEDNPVTARLLASFVQKSFGQAPLVAGSLAEFAALDGAGTDVVITDLSLPDSDGAATVEAVRRSCPLAAVVAVSATEPSEDVLMAGADDWLLKGNLGPDDVRRAVVRARAVIWGRRRHRLEAREAAGAARADVKWFWLAVAGWLVVLALVAARFLLR